MTGQFCTKTTNHHLIAKCKLDTTTQRKFKVLDYRGKNEYGAFTGGLICPVGVASLRYVNDGVGTVDIYLDRSSHLSKDLAKWGDSSPAKLSKLSVSITAGYLIIK